ncbi:MAG: hypothetical protein WAU68_04265, partial [Vitreimonas sp.]
MADFYEVVRDREQDPALLLKSLLTYLAGKFDDALAEIQRFGKVSESTFRAFMRLNAGQDALAAGYEPIKAGLSAYLRKRDPDLPAEMARIASKFAPEPTSDPRVPFFLDVAGIQERLRLEEVRQRRNFLTNYAGCWRVFRFTSERSSKLLTRGFINIKPPQVLHDI